MNAFDKRPGPFQKFFFKVPVMLHKIGLGGWERLLGAQWMLITHIGRKSGRRYYSMVDVMDYDKTSDTYYIEAAYGARADWYRNIQSSQVFEAKVGRRKFKARAGALTTEGAGEMLVQFYRSKPAYTRSVMAMAGMKFKDEAELRELGKNLTLLAVKPEEERDHPST